jgi:hypothetical protein
VALLLRVVLRSRCLGLEVHSRVHVLIDGLARVDVLVNGLAREDIEVLCRRDVLVLELLRRVDVAVIVVAALVAVIAVTVIAVAVIVGPMRPGVVIGVGDEVDCKVTNGQKEASQIMLWTASIE